MTTKFVLDYILVVCTWCWRTHNRYCYAKPAAEREASTDGGGERDRAGGGDPGVGSGPAAAADAERQRHARNEVSGLLGQEVRERSAGVRRRAGRRGSPRASVRGGGRRRREALSLLRSSAPPRGPGPHPRRALPPVSGARRVGQSFSLCAVDGVSVAYMFDA